MLREGVVRGGNSSANYNFMKGSRLDTKVGRIVALFRSHHVSECFRSTRAPSGSSNAAQPPPSGGLHP